MNRTMEKDDFKLHIDRLKASPVYSMSLGSKELFHSNFWAFLIETKEYRGLINAFFPDFSLETYERVAREDRHRDLTIYDKQGREFVIENKIKSYPRKDQLEEYSEKGNFALGAITGINKPPFELEGWTFVSYAHIVNELKKLNASVTSYIHDLVDDYCKTLDSINALMTMSLKEKEGVLSYWSDNIALLNEVNLMDVFKKNKADDFVVNGFGAERKAKYEELAKTRPDTRFVIERGFYNCKATLSFVFYVTVKDDIWGESIGVQIEEGQFRLFKGNRFKSVDEIFEEYSEKGWFDPSYDMHESRKIHDFETKMNIRSKYCKYGGHWIYQYFDLWHDGRETNYENYDVVAGLLDRFLTQAFGLLG